MTDIKCRIARAKAVELAKEILREAEEERMALAEQEQDCERLVIEALADLNKREERYIAISEAELVSRRAIRSLYEGRPLTDEMKKALKTLVSFISEEALVAEADYGLKYQGNTITTMRCDPPWEVPDE